MMIFSLQLNVFNLIYGTNGIYDVCVHNIQIQDLEWTHF